MWDADSALKRWVKARACVNADQHLGIKTSSLCQARQTVYVCHLCFPAKYHPKSDIEMRKKEKERARPCAHGRLMGMGSTSLCLGLSATSLAEGAYGRRVAHGRGRIWVGPFRDADRAPVLQGTPNSRQMNERRTPSETHKQRSNTRRNTMWSVRQKTAKRYLFTYLPRRWRCTSRPPCSPVFRSFLSDGLRFSRRPRRSPSGGGPIPSARFPTRRSRAHGQHRNLPSVCDWHRRCRRQMVNQFSVGDACSHVDKNSTKPLIDQRKTLML